MKIKSESWDFEELLEDTSFENRIQNLEFRKFIGKLELFLKKNYENQKLENYLKLKQSDELTQYGYGPT